MNPLYSNFFVEDNPFHPFTDFLHSDSPHKQGFGKNSIE